MTRSVFLSLSLRDNSSFCLGGEILRTVGDARVARFTVPTVPHTHVIYF
jgi:hypothetical protein